MSAILRTGANLNWRQQVAKQLGSLSISQTMFKKPISIQIMQFVQFIILLRVPSRFAPHNPLRRNYQFTAVHIVCVLWTFDRRKPRKDNERNRKKQKEKQSSLNCSYLRKQYGEIRLYWKTTFPSTRICQADWFEGQNEQIALLELFKDRKIIYL